MNLELFTVLKPVIFILIATMFGAPARQTIARKILLLSCQPPFQIWKLRPSLYTISGFTTDLFSPLCRNPSLSAAASMACAS